MKPRVTQDSFDEDVRLLNSGLADDLVGARGDRANTSQVMTQIGQLALLRAPDAAVVTALEVVHRLALMPGHISRCAAMSRGAGSANDLTLEENNPGVWEPGEPFREVRTHFIARTVSHDHNSATQTRKPFTLPAAVPQSRPN